MSEEGGNTEKSKEDDKGKRDHGSKGETERSKVRSEVEQFE